MPSTQKFDGPVLADLLAKVGTLGAGARILKAERKRSGGIGGFFAKEWFELTVEVPDRTPTAAVPTPVAAPTPVTAPVTSIVEMAEQVSASERQEAFHEVLQRVGTDAQLPVLTGGTPTAEEFVAAAQARLAALPQTKTVDEVAAVAVQNMAATVSLATGKMPVPPVAPPAALPAPVTTTVSARSPLPTPEVVDARAFVAAATSGLDPMTAARLIFGDALEDEATASPFAAVVDDLARRTEVVQPQPVIARVRDRDLAPAFPSTESDSFNAVLDRLAQQSDLRLDRAAHQRVSQPMGDLVPALLSLGVPQHLLPQSPSTVFPSLALPAAPALPSAVGTIIAVVGTRLAARRLARSLANELGRGDDGVMLASPTGESDIRSSDDLRAVRAGCRRPWVPATVIALGTPPGGKHLGWGRDVLDALEPDMVWGVIDADRKCEDVATWAHGLGGLDALALENLDATVTPAAVLSLGIPVARLDGRTATAEAWADLLTKRLVAA